LTRVYVDMVADLFHPGHVEFLRRARELGDVLVVGVHSDEAAAGYKRRPVLTMQERMQLVAACRFVDEVLADAPARVTPEWLDDHRIDLVVHGDDFDEQTLSRDYKAAVERGIMRTVPYTPGISTTELLERLRRRLCEDATAAGDRAALPHPRRDG
jgi:ethanolamine-phosphate cytidylyltransferase/choline-phosphate cytidylyltransferase